MVVPGAVQQGPQGGGEAGQALLHVHECRAVAQQQLDQAGEILALPVAVHEGLPGADGTAEGHGRPEGRVPDLHLDEGLALAEAPVAVALPDQQASATNGNGAGAGADDGPIWVRSGDHGNGELANSLIATRAGTRLGTHGGIWMMSWRGPQRHAGTQAGELGEHQPTGQRVQGPGPPWGGQVQGQGGGEGLVTHGLTPGQAPPSGGRGAGGR